MVLSWSEKSRRRCARARGRENRAAGSHRRAAPFHFNLNRDEERNFRLDVAKGGLYRVETLGRLKTSLLHRDAVPAQSRR